MKRKQTPPASSSAASSKPSLKSLREHCERLALQARVKLLESSNLFLANWIDPSEQYFDDPSFLPAWISPEQQVPLQYDNQKRGENLPVYLNEYQLKQIRDMSRRLCAFNEYAINAKDNRAAYVVGEGLQYKAVRRFQDQSPEEGMRDSLCQAVQDVIDEFLDINDFSELEQECINRCDEDGETFLRFFEQLDGVTIVRAIEPEHVKTPSGYSSDRMYSFGVETDREDVQKVQAYWLVSDPLKGVADERVPAEDVLHIKFNVRKSAKRGLPTFFPVRKNLERADKLLRNMSLMAQIQATFALIRKHTGYSAAAVQAYASSQVDATVQSPTTGRQQNFAQYLPGSIIDAPSGTEYEFPAGGINAANYVEILRAELRAIASRLNMPIWMLTCDAADMGAYTSSMVAESPSTKNFQRLRGKVVRAFGGGVYAEGHGRSLGALWRAIRNAVRAGRLSQDALDLIEIQVEGPSLVVRDQLQEANRNQILHMNRVLSAQTWAQQDGLDYDREQANLEMEAERNGPALPGLDMPGEEPPETAIPRAA